MRIAHIADIHIRGLSRHAEYKKVFQAFIDDVKKQKVDVIFIGGDIFHTKTIGITPEYIDFMRWWLEAMAEVAPVHLTLGNHDGNLMNFSRQDAVTPIIETLKNPRVFLYKKSGTYQFAPGMNWCVFSLFDEEGWKDVKPVKGEYNIACFHGSVRGAKTEADWELDSDITIEKFKEYDLCLLGDIHKTQFLDYKEYTNGRKPWIAYPGSTVQQNFGEDLVHGYLMWTIEENRTHEVEFHPLPNPNPFVTIEWQGNVSKTLKDAHGNPPGTRYRVKSNISITQKDISQLTVDLKQRFEALEVTYKIEESVDRDVISTGTMSIARNDLRNESVLLEMMKEYYESEDIDEDQWEQISALVKTYMKNVTTTDECNRNTKWSIKRLEFDNMYAYGEGNVINFGKLTGITGIFGPNRVGKSSIIGALLYNLFNASDRGSLKNLFLINDRKDYCLSRCTVTINGSDYMFERQTVKMENKKGPFGVTNLNAWKMNPDGTKGDELNGEQRFDTDKIIRNLIGSSDDFMITGVSTQDDMKKFIKEGATARKQVISRFLDLDIFDRLHDLANKDASGFRSSLKNLGLQDWDAITQTKVGEVAACDKLISTFDESINQKRNALNELSLTLSKMKLFEPTTEADVVSAHRVFKAHEAKKEFVTIKLQELLLTINDLNEKLEKLGNVKKLVNLDELRQRLEAQHVLQATLSKIEHVWSTSKIALAAKEKSILKLLEVPCGDEFPTCKFIKDSHDDKLTIADHRTKTAELLLDVEKANVAFEIVMKENLTEKIKKCEQVYKIFASHQTDVSNKSLEVIKLERELVDLDSLILVAKEKFESLDNAHKNSENKEMVDLKQEIANISSDIRNFERQKMASVHQKGGLENEIKKTQDEKQKYNELHDQLKMFELVSTAFSKRGIPNRIINSQLPLINHEISKILNGIVNFSVEFEADTESNSLDIYINYGDARRIIELGSGMEKVISSIAIRAAMSVITTLPKTDMFIIDEGFADLDETNVETCNRMIRSLKKYFKSIILITHIDGIKEVIDNMIEITRSEHDSKVVYE